MPNVWYLGPGGMAGASVAGAMYRLEEEGFKYPPADAFYTSSCSAIIGAAALTGQARKGAAVYLDDVVGNNYLRMNPVRMMVRNTPERIGRCMNTDYLIESLTRRIDVKRVLDLPNPFFIKLLNEDTNEVEYLDGRSDNILDMLRAAVNFRPFNSDKVLINGHYYADAANKESIGLLPLLQREGFVPPTVQTIDVISELPFRDDKIYLFMGKTLQSMLFRNDSIGYRLFLRRTCPETVEREMHRAAEESADVRAIIRIGEQTTLVHSQHGIATTHTTNKALIDDHFHEGFVLAGALLRDMAA